MTGQSASETEVNAHLAERWGRSKAAPGSSSTVKGPQSVRANKLVRKYGLPVAHLVQSASDSWLGQMEIPTTREILGNDEDEDDDGVDIPVNRIDGPWDSKVDYLRAHYELLREDAVAPLRDAVAAVKEAPEMQDSGGVCLYDKVYIIGYTFSHQGPATRVVFSTSRAGKRILWDQSKRLVPGTLVALSPISDKFQRECRVAIVAARPLTGVQANPPEVDILFATPQEYEVDPLQEWLMVEARTGYFEAYRHTLMGLQRMTHEKFPMAEHLVDLDVSIDPPRYVQQNPFLNLTSISSNPALDTPAGHVDILHCFPRSATEQLDQSQLQALERILTKKIAVVQGPPGTGKTHVSVTALKLLLNRTTEASCPIIITSQTNHALDQMLRHIAKFEDNFIRLGGRTLDQGIIKQRTLFEQRRSTNTPPIVGGLRGSAQGQLRRQEQKMTALLAPIHNQEGPLSAEVLREFRLLTEPQYESLERGALGWVQALEADHPAGSVAAWLGDELVVVDHHSKLDDLDFDFEESDLEFEQIKEMEAEAGANDDESLDCLGGTWLPIAERFTARQRSGVTSQAVERALRTKDMWEIPHNMRGAVYIQLQNSLKRTIRDRFRQEAQIYMKSVQDLKVGKWETDSAILQSAKLIGMTTTGLSKYRALVASLQPKILLVEEAAETLEGLVAAGCVESLEHLILVGDHKQLRGHCAVNELEGEPYNLGVSMFERLIMNRLEYSTLTYQRRMAPQIRKNLAPIYDELHDHPSVVGRPPVPGMQLTQSFFFTHQWPESQDSHFSRCNTMEGEMIVGFFNYLMYNGMASSDITILTFYNGQRKLILKRLRSHPNLIGRIFNVKTVDSYQGEENVVVILSLVRSNERRDIGFLSVENRVCVALSRAQRGFYLFGNALRLAQASHLWWQVVQIMSKEPKRVGFALPLTCQKHERQSWIKEPLEWSENYGGCEVQCGEPLVCGHRCALKCHPYPHDSIKCQQACLNILPCGHQCQKLCYDKPCECRCIGKTAKVSKVQEVQQTAAQLQSTLAWKEFANKKEEGQPGELAKTALLDIDFGDASTPKGLSRTSGDPSTDAVPLKVSTAKTLLGENGATRTRWKDTIAWSDWLKDQDNSAQRTDSSLEPSLLD